MSNLSINTVSSVGTISQLTPVEYPFSFLHAELVRHFKEREAESAKKKTEWTNTVKNSDFADVLNQNDGFFDKIIFVQVFKFKI